MSVWIGISSPSGLQGVKNDPGGRYKLLRDIDMEDFEFETIEDEFTGILDGQGHRIKNLTIDNGVANSSTETGGIFKDISGDIKNIKIDNANIKGKHMVAPLGARLKDSGTIKNVVVENLEIEAGMSYGGIIGFIGDNAEVSNCQVIEAMEMKGGSHSCGGITSAMEDNSRLENCRFMGKMTSGNRGLIVGRVSGENSIKNCLGILTEGDASGLWNSHAEIPKSEDSFYDSTLLEGKDNGVGKSTEELQTPKTYMDAGWDMSIWKAVPGRYAENPLKIETKNMLGFLYGTPYLEEVKVEANTESAVGDITSLRYDNSVNSMNKLASFEWAKSNGGEIVSLTEVEYNSKDQPKKTTEYSYEYRGDGEFQEKFNIEEIDYCWESAPESDELFQKNLMEFVDEITNKVAVGVPEGIKTTSSMSYRYDEDFNQVETWVSDPLVTDGFRKTEEVIERNPINNIPVKTKAYGLKEGDAEKEYLAELLLSKIDEESAKGSDVVVASFVSKGGKGFYYLPTADYEVHHLEESGWSTDGIFVPLKNSKFKNRVLTNSTNYSLTFSKLDDLDTERRYLLCGWVNPNGGSINLNDSPLVSGGDGWVYFEELIGNWEELELNCDPGAMIDYIWITDLEGTFDLNVYSNDLSRLNATIGKNGMVAYYLYDEQGRVSDVYVCDREGEVVEYKFSTYGYSRFSGYNRSKEREREVFFGKGAHNTVVNMSFLGRGDFYDEFPQEIEVEKDNFALKFKSLETDTDYGLFFKGSSEEVMALLTFQKTQEYPVRRGYYKLAIKDEEEFTSQEEYSIDQWAVIVQPGIFMLIGDGKLVLSAKTGDLLHQDGLKISTFNTHKFERVFAFENPITDMSFLDSAGRVIQNQYLSLNKDTDLMDEIVVGENVYNGYGELCIGTKYAPATDDALYRYRDDFLGDFGENGELEGGQLRDSLIALGAKPTDAAYAYMENKNKPLTGRTEEASINFGEIFATRSEFKVQSHYDGEGEVSIDGVPKIGVTSCVPYKGKVHPRKHDTAVSAFYTPDGEMIIGKIKNNLAASADFYTMTIELREASSEGRYVVSNQGSGQDKLGLSNTKDCDWQLIKVGENQFKIRAASGANHGKYIKQEGDETFSVTEDDPDRAAIFEKGDAAGQIRFKVSRSEKYWLKEEDLRTNSNLIIAHSTSSMFIFEESISFEVQSDWSDGDKVSKKLSPGSTEDAYYNFDPSHGRIVKVKEADIDQDIYVILDNYGQLRFMSNHIAGDSQWKYYKYDNLGRMTEVGVLNSGEIADPEDERESILEKANDATYPSADEGGYLIRYTYDLDAFVEEIDG